MNDEATNQAPTAQTTTSRPDEILAGLPKETNDQATFQGRRGYWVQTDCVFIEADDAAKAIMEFRWKMAGSGAIACVHNLAAASIRLAQAQARVKELEEDGAEIEDLRRVIAATRELSIQSMDEIREAAGAPKSKDDHSQLRAVDYVTTLRQQADALAGRLQRAWLFLQENVKDPWDDGAYQLHLNHDDYCALARLVDDSWRSTQSGASGAEQDITHNNPDDWPNTRGRVVDGAGNAIVEDAAPTAPAQAQQRAPDSTSLLTSSERLHQAIGVMLKDWQDGDFELPHLAAIHMRNIREKYQEVGKALLFGERAFAEFQRTVGIPSFAETIAKARGHQGPPEKPIEFAAPTAECHGLDTPERVCFYEQEFYVLSNFSSFQIEWKENLFDTSEAVYHWEKFPNYPGVQYEIMFAPSAHRALEIAREHRHLVRSDWDDVRVGIMRDILRAKVDQHEYVRRKLLQTGTRLLVENSWRDDFWGWGPNHDGQNMLGKLWMQIRAELRAREEKR